MGTAWPLLVRSGRNLLNAAPDSVDIKGVREDIERISGPETVHDLHVWSAGERFSFVEDRSWPSLSW